jgi:hypothetical protein
MAQRDRGTIPDAWPLLMTREQTCAYLGISPDTFFRVCSVPPVDMGAQVVRYHRWQIEQWAAALPPRLRQAQEDAHNARVEAAVPFDGAEAAAEERRKAALERMRADLTRTDRRGKHKVRAAG